MVTRIPSPPKVVPAPLRQAANNPPYPTDSTMPTAEERPSFEHVEAQGPSAPNGEGSRSRASSVSSHGTWNSEASEEEEQDDSLLPEALRPGPRKSAEQSRSREDLPSSLQPGVPKTANGAAPNGTPVGAYSPQQATTPLKSQNPYLNMQASPSAPTTQPPAPPVQAPVQAPVQSPIEMPTFITPKEELAGLSLNGRHDPENTHGQFPFPRDDSISSVKNDPLGKSATREASHSSNPWQDALDKTNGEAATQRAATPPPLIEIVPDIPPKNKKRTSKEPVRPTQLDVVSAASSSVAKPDVETPRTQAKKQRNEFYHIKHVNWYDIASKGQGTMRRSPILTQNANGPCPLLALVNALSLSTPDGEDTALVHTLKTREQVTLGLLLDAVFEELVRRSERSGRDFPDIGDLYSFLITLHTGMNVNPAFTATRATEPGGFEQTREMTLYGSFDIPLVHGWTAPSDSSVYPAFERSAKTFDEALNMQFLEEEFENKLQAGGLNSEEQQVFEDLTAVKHFLTTFPTQLSEHGLQTISSWMKPGQIAILFRNDHFCTLYKEPKKGTLMTLVTDAGFSTHDEVVWESLVDVNGAKAEFFSGDFRPVGAAPSASRQNSGTAGPSDGWQAASGRRSKTPPIDGKVPPVTVSDADVRSPVNKSEQEDLDLALALQLQEEEEEAHRREAASRQNAENDALSRQYLDRESSENDRRPALPPRRTQRPSQQSSQQPSQQPSYSGPIQASSRTEDGAAPPPSYEQAASDMPYREAGSTPRPPRQGNPLNALGALDAQRHQSAFAAQSGQQGPVMAPAYGRRRQSRFSSFHGQAQPGYTQQPQQQGSVGPQREEKCVIM